MCQTAQRSKSYDSLTVMTKIDKNYKKNIKNDNNDKTRDTIYENKYEKMYNKDLKNGDYGDSANISVNTDKYTDKVRSPVLTNIEIINSEYDKKNKKIKNEVFCFFDVLHFLICLI
jgi:hypothetical protein